jgi:hypothetical protein
LRELEFENCKLKHLLAEAELDKAAMKAFRAAASVARSYGGHASLSHCRRASTNAGQST